VYPQYCWLKDHALQRHILLVHLVQVGLEFANADLVLPGTGGIETRQAVERAEDILWLLQLQIARNEVIGAATSTLLGGSLDDMRWRVFEDGSAILVTHS